MCGILGEVSVNVKTDRKVFSELLCLSKRRGPDASAIVEAGAATFGFNRLSILDTSERGMQPVQSPSGRYMVILNGEIYNYKQLQNHFGINDSQLRSGSDVEVVSQLTDRIDKAKLPELLNGMFALAIYDLEKKELLLARDFAGIKPLFYGMAKDGIVFASQFDQVYKHPYFSGKLSTRLPGVRDYLELGYMQAPDTVYENIFQLQPGEMLIVSNELEVKKFMFATYPAIPKGVFEKETDPKTTQHFKELLYDVVRDQLVSDVPIGTFLSGGIDSSLITAVSKKQKNDIHAFTFNVEHEEMSELEQAMLYANSIDVNHITETLNSNSIEQLCSEHFLAYSEPFGDPSSLPTYIITKLARKHLTVLLSGDGGDELFWGYPRFEHVANSIHYYKYPSAIRKLYAGIERKLGKRVSYGISSFDTIGHFQLNKHLHLGYSFSNKLFGNSKHSANVDYLYDYTGAKTKEDVLLWLRWNEYYAHMQRILVKVDRASMHNSMEVRVPFLDKRIIDFSWSIKPELTINHHSLKYILKEVQKQYYPEDIINKKKKGFSIPYHDYLLGGLRRDVEEQVLDAKLFGSEHYNEALLKEYVYQYLKTGLGNSWGVWIVYAMQKWANNSLAG